MGVGDSSVRGLEERREQVGRHPLLLLEDLGEVEERAHEQENVFNESRISRVH